MARDLEHLFPIDNVVLVCYIKIRKTREEGMKMMVRVRIKVSTQGYGETKAWWSRHAGLRAVGEGSDRRVVADGEPSWLPRVRDGEAWIDLPAGTVIRAGASHMWRSMHARVASPALIVEEGKEWTAEDRDLSRQVRVTVTGARVATFRDLNASPSEPSPLATYSDEELVTELERRGYLVIRATADAEAK